MKKRAEGKSNRPASGEDKNRPSAEENNAADTAAGPEEPQQNFPVVGIGASAGGLEAIQAFLKNLPEKDGFATVIVTHRSPKHPSLLAEILNRSTSREVVEIADGQVIEAGHVYLAPPDKCVHLVSGAFQLIEMSEDGSHLPIDSFFRSLAEHQRQFAVGIVLSGTGSDGTLGVRSIKEHSGMVMIQDPSSALYSGMPASAVATGVSDYVATPEKMPEKLLAWLQSPSLTRDGEEKRPPQTIEANGLKKIFLLLRTRTGHDFSSYKPSTIGRRIQRRMIVNQIEDSIHYVAYLQENPHEIDLLFKELLISVTCFFRDEQAFDILKENALMKLLRSTPERTSFRVWVPGCATGEEVYSLAILLKECMEELHQTFEVQIFGTDLDESAIEVARRACYPAGISADVRHDRLSRFFIKEDSQWRVSKEIREMVVFAPQNVIKDPPFTKLDLIACRNLLIYLDNNLQKRVIPLFHYALKSDGILMLGPSESVGNFTDFFENVDTRWKIWVRRESGLPPHLVQEMARIPQGGARGPGRRVSMEPSQEQEGSVAAVLDRLLLIRFCPPCVIVNARGDIIHIRGRTGAWLEPASGQPRMNVLEMAREGLQYELSQALRQATTQDQPVVHRNLRVKSNGHHTWVTLSVSRILKPESVRGLLLMTFEPVPPPGHGAEPESEEGTAGEEQNASGEDSRLARELQFTRESLQTTIEELETSNEELKSSNEELQSTNEELQSSNEELETSREEMQSLNEELSTLNTELQSRIEALAGANDEMQNLLNSTGIAMIFLDRDLNIRRYTTRTRAIIKLIPTDIGRPIGDLTSVLKSGSLADQCRTVMDTLGFEEAEVETADGNWYLMRIMPFRTMENVIDGLILTFVEINHLKKAERHGRQSRALYESFLDAVPAPLLVVDGELKIQMVNSGFQEIFHLRAQALKGESILEIGHGEWNEPELRNGLQRVASGKEAVKGMVLEGDFSRAGRMAFGVEARPMEGLGEDAGLILVALERLARSGGAA